MKKSLKVKATWTFGLALMVFVFFSIIVSYIFYSQAVSRSGMDMVSSMQTQFFIIFTCAELIVALLVLVLIIYMVESFVSKPLDKLNGAVSVLAYDSQNPDAKLSSDEVNQRLKDLNISTGDEIEMLYHSIQKMQMDVNDYIVGMREQNWDEEHDNMTMLYNKAKYEKRKQEVYPFVESIYIARFDVINMKIVNSKLSTQAGDSIISKVARELRRISCDTIHAYRLQDDNFLVVMCGYKEEEAVAMLSKWNERVGRLNRSTDSFDCRLVWGGSYAERDFDVDDVFKRADAEMYCQKAIIKNEIGGIIN